MANYTSKTAAIAGVAGIVSSQTAAQFRADIVGLFHPWGPARTWTEWSSMTLLQTVWCDGSYWEWLVDPAKFNASSPF